MLGITVSGFGQWCDITVGHTHLAVGLQNDSNLQIRPADCTYGTSFSVVMALWLLLHWGGAKGIHYITAIIDTRDPVELRLCGCMKFFGGISMAITGDDRFRLWTMSCKEE